MEMKYGGLDVHKDFVQACWVNGKNEAVREDRFDTTPEGLAALCKAARGTRCVIESSTACFQVYDALQDAGVQVRVAHPLRVKAIASAKVKTDKVDARTLAQLECANLVPEAHLPSRQTRELRSLVNQHVSLTKEMTRIKNAVHASLLKQGITSSRNTFTAKNSVRVLDQSEGVTKLVLGQAFECLHFLKQQRDAVDDLINRAAEANPDAVLLQTLPGAGCFSALLLAAAIDGVERFPDAEHLVSYAGLAPSTRQSANVTRSGHISKQGNALMRWTLVQCSWKAVRGSKRFRKQFVRLLRKKKPCEAIVAVARKMLSIAYYMLSRKEEYDENA